MSEHKKKKHKSGKPKELREVKKPREPAGEKKTKPAKKSAVPKTGRRAKPRAKSTPGVTKRKKVTASEQVIHVEAISIRAYFLSENRRVRGEHGDEHGDWIEAERQLRAEVSRGDDPQD